MPRLIIDKKKCIGCGACVDMCPENFEMKDGKSCVKGSKENDFKCAKRAEAICPTKAIQVKG